MKGALSPGAQLYGQYQVEKVIGGGGFGLTYLGLDLRSMQQVCIKELFIHKQSVRHDDGSVLVATEEEDRQFFMERFLREASSLATFQHPHVVRVENYFEAGGTAYYVMEYVEGMTLTEHVRRQGGLDLGELRHIFRQLMDAVEAIHGQDLLHRDIKPSNVMLEPGLRVKLIDFGAAKDPKIQAKSGHTVVITDGFAPLEQYSAEGDIGPHSDIYSLGATMLFALTGKRPTPATSRQETLEQAEDLAPEIRDMLAYFMQSKSKDRPTSMASARAEFEQALSAAMQRNENEVVAEPEEAEGAELEESQAIQETSDSTQLAGLVRSMKSAGNVAKFGLVLQVVAWGLYWLSWAVVCFVLGLWELDIELTDIDIFDFQEAVHIMSFGLSVLGFFIGGLGFLRWFKRWHKVVHHCGMGRWPLGQEQWSWFVPVLNLFRPVQILRQTAQCCLDEASQVKVKTIAGLWWALWLISHVSGGVVIPTPDWSGGDFVSNVHVLMAEEAADLGLDIWDSYFGAGLGYLTVETLATILVVSGALLTLSLVSRLSRAGQARLEGELASN